jgi:hypothetical protein
MGNLSTGFFNHEIIYKGVASLDECYKIMGQDLSLFSAAKFLEVVGFFLFL